MTRAGVIAVLLAAALPAVAQETIVIEPSDPVTDILDQIAPLEETDEGESTLPQVPDRPAEEAASARGGVVRVLDKSSGRVTDLDLPVGETGQVGALSVTLLDCRYPVSNPAGDAYVLLTIRYRDPDPVFQGWMIASSPAVSAMDHPRYDVWALSCNNS
jgi:hypothetical protein